MASFGSKSICKNCGEPIVYLEGIHFTENGWCHDTPDNNTIACLGLMAEPS